MRQDAIAHFNAYPHPHERASQRPLKKCANGKPDSKAGANAGCRKTNYRLLPFLPLPEGGTMLIEGRNGSDAGNTASQSCQYAHESKLVL